MESEVARDNKGCKYSTRRPLLCLKKTVEQSKRERKIAQNKKLAVLQTAATAITRTRGTRGTVLLVPNTWIFNKRGLDRWGQVLIL